MEPVEVWGHGKRLCGRPVNRDRFSGGKHTVVADATVVIHWQTPSVLQVGQACDT